MMCVVCLLVGGAIGYFTAALMAAGREDNE